MKNKQAFTLIELLVVVLIIGILAAVALPQYQKAVAKARAAEWMTTIDAAQKALTAYVLSGAPEKTFLSTNGTSIVLDKRDELDIFIPISDRLLFGYAWGISASPTEWDLGAAAITAGNVDIVVSGDPFSGGCVGYDKEGVIICRTLAQHYPSFTCRDGSGDYSGRPPLCN